MSIPLDWDVVGPATIVACAAIVGLLVDAFFPRRTWLGPGLPSALGLVVAGIEVVGNAGPDLPTRALSMVVLVGALMVVVTANVMNYESSMPPGEFHFLMLASAAGGLVLVAARDLATLVVALELLSLPSIALVGLRRGDAGAVRAAWTFFLASVTATAVTVMGVSLLYGATGSLRYGEIGQALALGRAPDSVVAAGSVLTLVGLLFKIGAVPFHLWVPDTYRGASVLVAAFLSSVSKAAALGALLVLTALALAPAAAAWAPVVAVVAGLTMTLGNLGALRQKDAVGLLAWSSVAQAGFVIAPVAAITSAEAVWGPIRYLAIYVVANLVAFGVVAIMVRLRGGSSFDHLHGLLRTDAWMAVPLVAAVLTLAGFPPMVLGLLAKYVVLRPVLDGAAGWHDVLAVVMGLNIVLGLAYYLRFLVVLAGDHGTAAYHSPSPPVSVRVAKTVVLLGTAALVVLSVAPGLLLDLLP